MKLAIKPYATMAMLLTFGITMATGTASQATLLTIDEVVFSNNPVIPVPSVLTGTADLSLSADMLTITLTNTSAEKAGTDDANNLLTGLGFNLPVGVAIGSGSANIAGGSSPLNFPGGFSGTDVSQEWGYDTDPLDSGPFKDITSLSLNTAVATLQASVQTQFASGSIDAAPNVSGPDFGLLASGIAIGNGLEAIRNSLVIKLNLTGLSGFQGNLISFIDQRDVVLSFGSPTTARTGIPEPSALLLFAFGLLGAGAMARRRR